MDLNFVNRWESGLYCYVGWCSEWIRCGATGGGGGGRGRDFRVCVCVCVCVCFVSSADGSVISMLIIFQPHYDSFFVILFWSRGGGGCVEVPPPPPPSATFSGLAQNFRSRRSSSETFALPKKTPWRRPWNGLLHSQEYWLYFFLIYTL